MMSIRSMRPSTSKGDRRSVPNSDIDQIVTELAVRFPAVPSETVRTVVTEEFGFFDGAAISTFVPVLVAKAATARLTGNGTFVEGNTHTRLSG
jgi:hypothetical protein